MARSNFNNPMRVLARAVERSVNADVRLTQGAQSEAVPDAAPQPVTKRTGDGSAENPYRARHVFMLGIDALGDADTYLMGAPQG